VKEDLVEDAFHRWNDDHHHSHRSGVRVQHRVRLRSSGLYIVDFPDIPDIMTSGSTLPEAFGHACEALDLYLDAIEQLG
jgi:hypothetical protein